MRGPGDLSDAEIYRLPRPSAPAPTAAGFVQCPVHWQQTPEQQHCQQELYRLALEQAQAVVRPSLPERDLVAVWN
jgi:hypothetical protein